MYWWEIVGAVTSGIITIILTVVSMKMFYDCYIDKGKKFNVGEFLAAFFYPFIYIIYRGVTYKDKCKKPET